MYKTDILFFKVKTLCVLLRPTNTDFLVMHKFLRHANFFLKLIVRSMAQHILESGRIKVYKFSLPTRTEQFPENDEYNLNAYIRINSKLISEVNHFETQLKNLNSEQTEIINYIKENFDSQMLMFLSGEGGCGKSYLLNVIHIMLSGLNVQKLATTGNAASLIDGQTVHDFFLLTIN